MTLRLFDTMSREQVAVEPLEADHIRLYTCGPTVWNRVHIGNFRTFVFEDVLRRWLDRSFPRVTHVMNLTDVDDRIIKNATEHGQSLEDETAPWIASFDADRHALGLRPAHHFPRATAYIEEMVALVERLEQAGAAYRSDGSYYFHIPSFARYGALSGARAEGLVAGASGRVDDDDYAKEDVRDFALWKAAGAGEIGWDTRLGRGRPGWHIECSAMSMALLGESFDIHCGGVDNIFPHHENEIAQSEAATGRTFVRVWCHSAHLRIAGEKMAKRLGNFETVAEVLESGGRAAALRYMLAASTHYRKSLNYSDDSLAANNEPVDRLLAFRDRIHGLVTVAEESPADEAVLTAVRHARNGFADSMDDDLNLPEAMGAVFVTLREVNRILDTAQVTASTQRALRELVDVVDDVLGIFPIADRERGNSVSGEEQSMLDARQTARDERRWSDADRIRKLLLERGITVDDTPQGQRWRRAR